MDTTILEDLGLTRAEIKVFITSLESGPGPAGPIVEKSGLQNAVVHRTLHSLINKGLITYVMEGRKKRYSAVSPDALIDFIDEKKDRLQKILPELTAKQELSKRKPEATIFRGIKGIKEILHLVLDGDGSEYITYGGGLLSEDNLGQHFWDAFHRKRVRNKIPARLMFHENLKHWGEKLNERKLSNVRYYSEKQFDQLTETIICGNRVGIILWLEIPHGFLIESAEAAISYSKFFEVIWKASRN